MTPFFLTVYSLSVSGLGFMIYRHPREAYWIVLIMLGLTLVTFACTSSYTFGGNEAFSRAVTVIGQDSIKNTEAQMRLIEGMNSVEKSFDSDGSSVMSEIYVSAGTENTDGKKKDNQTKERAQKE